jgi:hypothetical protein
MAQGAGQGAGTEMCCGSVTEGRVISGMQPLPPAQLKSLLTLRVNNGDNEKLNTEIIKNNNNKKIIKN